MLVALTACAPSSPPRTVERVAFLSLDNLSGDDSLAWMGEAVPNIAAAQLAGVGKILPLRADSSREAAVVAATQMVHGYFDRRGGKLHFEFSVEDADTHVIRPLALDGDALHAADGIARALDASAKPFSTASPQAVEAWGKRNFEQAVQLDPDFGVAWRDLVQSRAADQAAASESAGRALARTTLRSGLERAQIALLDGQLRADAVAASKARGELVRLVPNDTAMLRRFADEETTARNFAQSVQFYQALMPLETGDPSVGNLLGYAQFFGGDLAGARKSFEAYGRLPGQAANALDSEGEVLFMAGRFAEAEQRFLSAHAANPAMLGGADLLKAAFAHWLGGDLPGADKIFDQYIMFRLQNADSLGLWRRAIWGFATGREANAIDLLKQVTGSAAAMAQAQLQVLNNRAAVVAKLTEDLPGLERAYRSTPPSADGMVRVLYAKALLKAGRKAEAENLVVLWPLPESGEASLQPLLYSVYLELKKDLAK